MRAFDALPGNPFGIGVGFAAGLLLLYSGGRWILDSAGSSNANDLRIALTQILMTAYFASAYAYLLASARRTTMELSPVVDEKADWPNIVDRVATHRRGILPMLGAASFLVVGVGVTNVTTPAPVNPWDWQAWSYDVFWHRVTTVFFVWWIAGCCYVVVVESARLSRLAEHFRALDLFQLKAYQPLVRQGLTNALLIIGGVSVMSLLGVESRYASVLAGFWISSIVLAWIGLMLPLRGIRGRVRKAKERELEWCNQALIASRDKLKSAAHGKSDLGEIIAYRDLISRVRNWPFDHSTLVRFALYLLIPLGSWLGGALVERALDLFLN